MAKGFAGLPTIHQLDLHGSLADLILCKAAEVQGDHSI